MPMFTKKPVTVEAVQITYTYDEHEDADGFSHDQTPWMDVALNYGIVGFKIGDAQPNERDPLGQRGHVVVRTLEGKHEASDGDWIIKGVKGELYPCKPDIFEQTYSPGVATTPFNPREHMDAEDAATIDKAIFDSPAFQRGHVSEETWRKGAGLKPGAFRVVDGPQAVRAAINRMRGRAGDEQFVPTEPEIKYAQVGTMKTPAYASPDAIKRSGLDDGPPNVHKDLRSSLAFAINYHSAEGGSNTPDFILASFLKRCLFAFDMGVMERESWYGREDQSPADLADQPSQTVREADLKIKIDKAYSMAMEIRDDLIITGAISKHGDGDKLAPLLDILADGA